MSWFRVDDTLCMHKKAQKAGKALALWVMCGSYVASAAGSGDGSLDMFEVESVALGMRMTRAEWHAYARRLVEVGLWDDLGGDRFAFHDWQDYASADGALEARKAKDAERARRAREKKNASRDASRDDDVPPSRDASRDEPNASRDGSARVTCAPTHASRDPVPSRPVPTQVEKSAGEPAPAAPPPPVLSDLGEKILAAAAKLPRVGPLVDAAYASELALIADRCGKAGLVGKALDEADGKLAANGGPVDVGQGRDVIQRFIRNALPDRPPRRGAVHLQPTGGQTWEGKPMPSATPTRTT